MSREKCLITLLIISAFLLTGSFAFAEEPDQLQIIGPKPNQVPIGTTKAIRATVLQGFVGVEGAEVVFTKKSGSFSFTEGVVSPDGTQSVVITDSSGIALIRFIAECTGPGLIEVTVTETELSAFSIFDITEAISSDMLKGPYLIYNGTNTEMEVLWQLSGTRCCTIEWGLDTSYNLGSAATSEYGSDHQYKYTITSLTPGSKYYYRVTESGSFTYTGDFLAAPSSSAGQVKFLAYGDTRTNPADHDAVCAAMIDTYTADPDYQSFLLNVGDWTEDGTESQWNREYFDPANAKILMSQIPINGCKGNHEDRDVGDNYAKYWPYPYVADHYWSFDYGPAHIAVIDQYVPYQPGSAQYAWLENDLAGSNAEWKFLLMHEPAWSAESRSNEITIQNTFQPLCLAYDVDIVLAGHSHFYARCDVDGVQHITTGGGGAPLSTPDTSYPYVVLATEAYHFCEIDIQDNTLNFTSRNIDGSVIDSFTLNHPICDDGPCDLTDFARLGLHWLDTGCVDPTWCGKTDFDKNGDVTIDDVILLAENWLLDFTLKNLKGHWKLDGDATDSSSYGNGGTVYGAPSWDPNGQVDGALIFDGDDYVEITSYKGISGPSSRTVSAWLRTTNEGTIVSWGDSGTSGGWWLFRVESGGRLRLQSQGGYIVGVTDLRDDSWHHVAAVLRNDGSADNSEVEFYVDGIEEEYSSVSSQSINTVLHENVTIGAALIGGSPAVYFTGMMDDVRIYGTALSEAEIQVLASHSGILAHWELDDDTGGLTAVDSSGYNHDGTLTNMDPNNWVAGKVGSGALDFDGVDDYVEVTGYKGVTGTDSRTCAAWIKTTGTGAIVSWGDSDINGGWWLFRVEGGGRLRLQTQGGAIVGSTDLRGTAWHHVAAVLADDGSPDNSEVKLYVDGVEETYSGITSQQIDTASHLNVTIGASYLHDGTVAVPFTGQIDDVRIYGRVLSETEIQALAGMGN